jgi:hypothetical protein
MIFEHDDILSQIVYHLDYISIRNLSKTCNYLHNKMPEIISSSLALSNSFSIPSTSSFEWDKWDCTRDITQNHKNLAIASGDAYAVFFHETEWNTLREPPFDLNFSLQYDDQDLNELEEVFNCNKVKI